MQAPQCIIIYYCVIIRDENKELGFRNSYFLLLLRVSKKMFCYYYSLSIISIDHFHNTLKYNFQHLEYRKTIANGYGADVDHWCFVYSNIHK